MACRREYSTYIHTERIALYNREEEYVVIDAKQNTNFQEKYSKLAACFRRNITKMYFQSLKMFPFGMNLAHFGAKSYISESWYVAV